MENKEITWDELVHSPEFRNNVQAELGKLFKARMRRPAPPKGKRYKRDWYDRLGDTLTTKFCIDNILAIWNKESNLNSETRNVVKYICNLALPKTIEELNPEKKEEVKDGK